MGKGEAQGFPKNVLLRSPGIQRDVFFPRQRFGGVVIPGDTLYKHQSTRSPLSSQQGWGGVVEGDWDVWALSRIISSSCILRLHRSFALVV